MIPWLELHLHSCTEWAGITLSPFLRFFLSLGRSVVEHPELHSHIPACHFWDQSEPRLFVCEAIPETGLQPPDQKKNQTEGTVRGDFFSYDRILGMTVMQACIWTTVFQVTLLGGLII